MRNKRKFTRVPRTPRRIKEQSSDPILPRASMGHHSLTGRLLYSRALITIPKSDRWRPEVLITWSRLEGKTQSILKQRKTSRTTCGASKQRRDQINKEIQRLRDLLPLNSTVKDRLFQLQVMSLTCIYIRKQRYLPHSKANSFFILISVLFSHSNMSETNLPFALYYSSKTVRQL
jgi:hypothetical protein